ncbi:AAA family ATPase [Planktothrix sp. FACHB-1365]|uniref:AAA family ATPase n=1 Tax=Planktothrix sp. FACHB-1365 TaxID=2692855 RepID=UPI00168505BD|nr:AAA family ATPase [Planktothrix sp. FACHB-1365]MBD2480857.1 AAA family ATPase [Planktothrix sp. FACHB-1365]
MLTLSGFGTTTLLYSSPTSLVYRGYWVDHEQPVVLKVLREQGHNPKQLARFQREYELIQSLNLPGVVKVYGLEHHHPHPIMILEDFGGESLKQLSLAGQLNLIEFLQLAIAITKSLGQIHGFNIIHKDINPSNIILNPQTGIVKLIDFGIASVLSQENLTFISPNTLEGTLAYLSPEQTGRMNRPIDYRSDFYALGVTLYELLTGRLPFQSDDPLELVHSHIAKTPISPRHYTAFSLPDTLSGIILKLMAKNAEDRYQSAYGIKSDLEHCLEQIKTQGDIDFFPLGSQDLSDKLQIPEKLYGREHHLQTLLKAFERVSQGNRELIWISGYSGVGKSALVREIHKPVTAKRGIFISGKFDQYKRNIPYFAIAQALNEFCHQILTERKEILEQWKQKILAFVENKGHLLIDVIPHLERVIGKTSAPKSLDLQATPNCFLWTFKKLIQALIQPQHPLVIFLDDLQWADWASLNLIKTLIQDETIQYLMIIGAYRHHELNLNPPLKSTLEVIKESQDKGFKIILNNLNLSDINHLIAEGLNCSLEVSQSLANLVYQKTQGNPFFTKEFLKSLYTEGLLQFQYPSQLSWIQGNHKGKWTWNLEQIQAKNITNYCNNPPKNLQKSDIINSSNSLDIASIFKASQALSREISIEHLLTKIMKIVLENAGAERGYLILESDEQWFIQASVTTVPDQVQVLQNIPIEWMNPHTNTPEVCNAIVNYVIHTQESLVIHDATEENKFTSDNYILLYQPKSILCVPLLNQGKLIGILYLENNLMAGAFTSERLEILNLLSSQAAISIENARLYQTLEEKVTERTQALQQEILERKRIEQALRESQERFELAMRGANDGLWDWNIITGEAYYSPRYQEMLGYTEEEFSPKIDEFIQRIHPEDRDFVLNQIYKYIYRKYSHYEIILRMRHKQGHYIWILSRGIGLPERPHKMTRIVGINIDITERKKVEEALKEAKEDAEAASHAKSEFLANMSHELRTPLNGILGYTQILKRSTTLSEKEQAGIQIIHQCGTHLLTLINDILDLSKIEAGKLDISVQPINLETFLKDVIEICAIKAKQKGLTFIYMPLSQLPTVVEVDEKRLRQILINLLGNAVKFTDSGKLTFSLKVIEKEGLTTSLSTHHPLDTTLQFQIEDTGIGMNSEQLERIFLPFEQVAEMSYRAEGTGLGLAITQRLIKHLGGDLFVESHPGKGSKFWFELTLPASSEWQPIPDGNSLSSIVGFRGEKYKILVVDDKPENRLVLVDLLQPLGFEVLEASNGQEGLDQLEITQAHLVIADLLMPIMDGFEMTRRIRSLPKFNNIPVIATSASVYEWDRQQSHDAGCNDFLPKPLQVEDLLHKLKTWLKLEWEYDRPQQTWLPPLSENPLTLVIPSPEILDNLVKLAKRGRVLELEEEVMKLKAFDPRWSLFADRIKSMTQEFQLTQIKEFLNQCTINSF